MRSALLVLLPLVLAAADPVPAPPEVGKALRAAAPNVAAVQERFAAMGEALRVHLASGGSATAIPAVTPTAEEVVAALRRLEPGRHDDAAKSLELVTRAHERTSRRIAAFAKEELTAIGPTALVDLLSAGRYIGASAKIEAERDGAIGYETELIYVVPYPADKEGRPRVGRLRIEVQALWDGRKAHLLAISDIDLDKP